MNINLNKKFCVCLLLIILLLSIVVPSFGTSETTFSVSSPSALLMDLSSGKILYEKNSNQKMYPASLTKVLTAIIVLENCELNEIATVSQDAVMTVSSRICNSKSASGRRINS